MYLVSWNTANTHLHKYYIPVFSNPFSINHLSIPRSFTLSPLHPHLALHSFLSVIFLTILLLIYLHRSYITFLSSFCLFSARSSIVHLSIPAPVHRLFVHPCYLSTPISFQFSYIRPLFSPPHWWAEMQLYSSDCLSLLLAFFNTCRNDLTHPIPGYYTDVPNLSLSPTHTHLVKEKAHSLRPLHRHKLTLLQQSKWKWIMHSVLPLVTSIWCIPHFHTIGHTKTRAKWERTCSCKHANTKRSENKSTNALLMEISHKRKLVLHQHVASHWANETLHSPNAVIST